MSKKFVAESKAVELARAGERVQWESERETAMARQPGSAAHREDELRAAQRADRNTRKHRQASSK